jgi:hypothetical protein
VSFDGATLTQDGTDFAVGEVIDVGGGFAQTLSDADYIPEGCEYDEGFFVGPRP